MLRLRTNGLALLGAVAFAACSSSQSTPVLAGRGTSAPAPRAVAANFAGSYDATTGKFTVEMLPPDPTDPNALTAALPAYDNATGSNPANTFEIANDPTPANAPAIVSGGCGAGVDAFEGHVQIQSFFRNQAMRNIYAQIYEVSGTGNAGCNSSPGVPAEVSSILGVWSYGDLAAMAGPTSVAWRFRYGSSSSFTFRGRLFADLDPVVHASGAAEFDWTPTALLARKSFKDVGTTTAHLVWDGSTWVTTTGAAINLQLVGSAPGSHLSGLLGEYWVGSFPSGTYYVADAAHGGNLVDTSGSFTVCAKFKPAPHLGMSDLVNRRVIVAKGTPESGSEGWSLQQVQSYYAFRYRSARDNDLSRGQVLTWLDQQGYYPETYDYDYVCGGRNVDTTTIDVLARGARGQWDTTFEPMNVESGSFTSASSLPLVIGAYANATMPMDAGGVYEVIFDSRGASTTVMREIVAAAENAGIDGSSTASYFLYDPTNGGNPVTTATTSVAWMDGTTHTLAPDLVTPVALDGSGLLEAGGVVKYLRILPEATQSLGYCIGADVVPTSADGSWSAASGGVLGLDDHYDHFPLSGSVFLSLNPLTFHDLDILPTETKQIVYSTPLANGPHTIIACVRGSAAGGSSTGANLYIDNRTTPVATAATYGYDAANWNSLTRRLHIGEGGPIASPDNLNPAPLVGARIRRVFACPSPDPTTCL